MGGQYHIAGLPDPTLEHEAVNLRTLNQKVLKEIGVNNFSEAWKYLRLDGQNQMVSDLQMNDHKLVGLADAVMPSDGVNKKVLDEAVNSLSRDLTTESQRCTDNLIVQTNESLNREIERIEGSITLINGRIVTNSETDKLKETILTKKLKELHKVFLKELLIYNSNLENYKSRKKGRSDCQSEKPLKQLPRNEEIFQSCNKCIVLCLITLEIAVIAPTGSKTF